MSEPGSGYVVEEWNGDEEYNIIIILRKQIHRTSLTCLPLCFSTLFVLIFVAGPSDSRGRLTPSFKIISFDKTKYKGGQKVWNEISQDRCPQFEWWQWAFCLRSRQLDREHIFGTLHLRRTSFCSEYYLAMKLVWKWKQLWKSFLDMTILYQYCYFVVPFLPGQNFGDTSMRHTQSAGDITRSDLQMLMNVIYIFVPYRCMLHWPPGAPSPRSSASPRRAAGGRWRRRRRAGWLRRGLRSDVIRADTGHIVSKLSGWGGIQLWLVPPSDIYLSNLIHMETFKLLLILFSEFVEISFQM